MHSVQCDPRPAVGPATALTAILDYTSRDAIPITALVAVVPALLEHGEHERAEELIRSCVSWIAMPGAQLAFTRSEAARAIKALSLHIGRVPAAADAISRIAFEVSMAPGRRTSQGPERDEFALLGALLGARHVLVSEVRAIVQRRWQEHVRELERWRWIDRSRLSPADVAALIDAGLTRIAVRLLARRRPQDPRDLLEWAGCAYRLGARGAGDRALSEFEDRGQDACFESAAVAAAYLSANRLRVRTFFDGIAAELPAAVAPGDGRVRVVSDSVVSGQRVLEVGCGKGRFLKAIQDAVPGIHCIGVDLSAGLLKSVHSSIATAAGTLESIPCLSESFDTVFSVEAIEHSANWRVSVQELLRVCRPGGWVIIIDKPQSAWGWLPCPPWERWPAEQELLTLMRQQCDHLDVVPVSYDNMPADGRIVAWRGRKR